MLKVERKTKIKNIHISMMDMLMSLSMAIDLVSPKLASHHKMVAYLSHRIAGECGLSDDERNEIFMAALLHDVGSIALKDRLEILRFEMNNSSEHAELGYLILMTFPPFEGLANIVRYHHVPWRNGQGAFVEEGAVPIGSHLINLADRISVLVEPGENFLGQVQSITGRIEACSGRLFVPEHVEAFNRIAAREALWLDMSSRNVDKAIASLPTLPSLSLNLDDLVDLSRLFSRIIDSRSNFTATHSSGVAATATALARLSGFSHEDQKWMEVSGYLHDLGKLVVPPEILEKPGKLSDEEWDIMRSHTYYTYAVLDEVQGLEKVKIWGALHHERLDGSGYPFHHDGEEMTLGSRILAVADVFTAISEDRPYRKGMDKKKILELLKKMAVDGAIDADIVDLLEQNYEEVDLIRSAIQEQCLQAFELFWTQKRINEAQATPIAV